LYRWISDDAKLEVYRSYAKVSDGLNKVLSLTQEIQTKGHLGYETAERTKQIALKAQECAKTRVPKKAIKRFDYPTWQGYRLDWCREYASNCGQGAADAFCKKMGYSRAVSFKGPDMAPNKTKCVGSGQTCEGDLCGGFYYIDCEK